MRAFTAISSALLGACATAPALPPSAAPGSSAAQATTPATASAAEPASTHAEAAALARGLGLGASYADLVRSARVLLRAQGGDSNAECLLRRDAAGFVMSADLMPALDTLPDVPPELDPLLQRDRGRLGVLTAYGPLGSADATLGLCSFTTFAPVTGSETPLALLVTDEGVYVRRGDVAASEADGPLPATAAVARALSSGLARRSVVFVGAEASVPLEAIAALLALLPHDQATAFAVPLPAGTKLPAPPARESPHACPAGLPAPDPKSAEGDLDPKAIVAALGPLRTAAETCVSHVRGRASAGGRLVLALRISAEGRAQQACLLEDPIGDATLAGCVIDAALGLRFPAPNPAGFVDVHLPLALAPEGPRPQRALCE